MKVIEAPSALPIESPSIFMCGGITLCPDWQANVIEGLSGVKKGFLLNPRRDNWDMAVDKAEAQIEWEHHRILWADAHLFWFAQETLQPIALFELGKVLAYNRPLFIGVHPQYPRKRDVVHQTHLMRPDVQIRKTIGSLVQDVKDWLK